MTLTKKSVKLLMVSLSLIFLMSLISCATVNEKGWTYNGDGTYTVTTKAARKAATDKAENKKLKQEVEDDTLWNSITHNTTVFGSGVSVGILLMLSP